MNEVEHVIEHNEAAHRFETTVDGHLCVADYQMRGGALWLLHTGVPDAVGGRGIAGALAQAALEYVRAQGLKIEPACSYVDAYMTRHPEFEELRA